MDSQSSLRSIDSGYYPGMFRQFANRPCISTAGPGVQTIEQLVIALRKLREETSLLANKRVLAAEARALADQVDRKNVQRLLGELSRTALAEDWIKQVLYLSLPQQKRKTEEVLDG
jgi:hypothetical protein